MDMKYRFECKWLWIMREWDFRSGCNREDEAVQPIIACVYSNTEHY